MEFSKFTNLGKNQIPKLQEAFYGGIIMTKYVIDASPLNDLQDNYLKDIPIFEPIYNKVYEMFDTGELFSVREVYEELKDSQEFLEDYKHCFRELTENDSKNVSDILFSEEFKGFVEKV